MQDSYKECIHGGDVFSGEGIRGIGDEEACLEIE
jgi:hypothetical protein